MINLHEKDKEYVLNTYNRSDLIITRAENSYLYDIKGNKYLDMYTGISVNNLGHDKNIVDVMFNQASNYIHLSNYFVSEPVVNLAKLLVENSFASKVFFTNSGTESNEAAIKVCKKYGRRYSENKYELLSAYNSFHGRTNGGLSLTGKRIYQKDFMPLLPGINNFEYNDINSLREQVNENTCGLFLEMIQGEGGIIEISQDFIDEAIRLSKKHNFLIVIDEIQTGLGRTGDLFAFEKYRFIPDIVTLSKSLGGGLPLGAMLLREGLEDIFKPGDHGSTFGGNPVACACGEYILFKLLKTDLLEEVGEKSKYLKMKLHELKDKYPSVIKGVRGRGLMVGIDVGEHIESIKKISKEKKLLLNSTSVTVIRLLPSLYITKDELNEFLSVFEDAIIVSRNQWKVKI